MKNVLFASTALVAASFASASLAADPITASVRGYAHIGLIYQDNDSDPEIGILNDGEIHFRFRGTSDNGLTFDGEVELESFTSGDQIDEYWARVSGSFGAIKIGADDTASEDHEVGVFYGPGAHAAYFDGFQSILFSTNAGDVPSIRYTSPTFSGFSISADWAPDSTADPGNQQITFGSDSQRWSVGASWSGEFSGVDVAIGGGYLDGDLFASARYHVGVQIGYQGFSFGVHFDSAGNTNPVNGPIDDDGAIAVGLEYQTGPWTFAGGATFTTSGEDTLNWGVWAVYALAPGVNATLSYEGNDADGVFDTTVYAYLSLGF
ncbi:MAG: porin [Pseudomonadota bacterium]